MISRLQVLLFVFVGSLSLSTHAESWQTIEIVSRNQVVSAGAIQTVSLPSVMTIAKLFVQAESAGRDSALFDVVVNGDPKGTIMTPSVDPTYVVTVADTASSIQFRSLSGGAFRLIRVLAVVQAPTPRDSAGRLLPNKSALTQMAVDTIDTVREMEQAATPAEMASYLLPIKTAAGRLYAVAAARGPASELSRQAVVETIAAIEAAHPFLNQQMQKNGSFDCIVHLLTLKANLSAMID